MVSPKYSHLHPLISRAAVTDWWLIPKDHCQAWLRIQDLTLTDCETLSWVESHLSKLVSSSVTLVPDIIRSPWRLNKMVQEKHPVLLMIHKDIPSDLLDSYITGSSIVTLPTSVQISIIFLTDHMVVPVYTPFLACLHVKIVSCMSAAVIFIGKLG